MIENLIIAGIVVYLIAQRGAGQITQGIGRLSFQVMGVDYEKTTLQINIPFTNMTNAPLPVTDFLGGVYVSGQYLGGVTLSNGQTVPAGGDAVFSVLAEVRHGDLFNSVVSYIDGGGEIRVKGKFYAGQISIPVNERLY